MIVRYHLIGYQVVLIGSRDIQNEWKSSRETLYLGMFNYSGIKEEEVSL